MNIDEQLLREVQMQTAILRAAYREVLSDMEEHLRSDTTFSAIIKVMEECTEGVAAGTLIEHAATAANSSKRTIQRRLSKLEEMGVVRRTGRGSNIKYELTGLVG